MADQDNMEAVARAIRAYRIVAAPDGFRIFQNKERIEGPWSHAEIDDCQSRLSELQAQAALSAIAPDLEGLKDGVASIICDMGRPSQSDSDETWMRWDSARRKARDIMDLIASRPDPSARDGVQLHCSRGTVTAHVGDEFEEWGREGVRWRIEGFTSERIYSPSGFGGTPAVRCRPLEQPRAYWQQFIQADGTVEWCGDSVGAELIRRRVDSSLSSPEPANPGGEDA